MCVPESLDHAWGELQGPSAGDEKTDADLSELAELLAEDDEGGDDSGDLETLTQLLQEEGVIP